MEVDNEIIFEFIVVPASRKGLESEEIENDVRTKIADARALLLVRQTTCFSHCKQANEHEAQKAESNTT